MAKGKYDAKIFALAASGKGGRLISKTLGVNNGYVWKRMYKLGVLSEKKNQHQTNPLVDSNVVFKVDNNRLFEAAELYLMFICELSGFKYAKPPSYESYDLLVDFGLGWKKVQVKSSCGITFTLHKTRVNSKVFQKKLYNDTEIDFFFLYRSDGRSWLIPFEYVKGKGTCRAETMFPSCEVVVPGVGLKPT